MVLFMYFLLLLLIPLYLILDIFSLYEFNWVIFQYINNYTKEIEFIINMVKKFINNIYFILLIIFWFSIIIINIFKLIKKEFNSYRILTSKILFLFSFIKTKQLIYYTKLLYNKIIFFNYYFYRININKLKWIPLSKRNGYLNIFNINNNKNHN